MRAFVLALLIVGCASAGVAGESVIFHPFVTDGCTGYRDGTRQDPNLWRACCVEHDLHFWAGGTKAMRDATDLRLRDCVRATGQKTEAEIIYLGVRLGSLSPVKIPGMGWGNAWAKSGYRKLTRADVAAITADLPRYDLPREMELGLIDSLNQD
jgi:hypothetical protein